MEKTCSILILSCDKNLQLLKLFFEMFDKYWADCQYDVYVSMEFCKEIPVARKIHVLNFHENKPWSNRIINALDKIDTENVLILLDDFIIEEKVESSKIDTIVANMNNDSRIANVILTVINQKNEPDKRILESYVQRNKYGRYKTALQCGIWKRSILINLLTPNENAWETEIFSNIRSFKYSFKFYALENIDQKPIVYNDGFLIVQGKLNTNEKMRLNEKLNINIKLDNYEKTGEDFVRDNIKFIPRVVRRLKIIVLYVNYRYFKRKEW